MDDTSTETAQDQVPTANQLPSDAATPPAGTTPAPTDVPSSDQATDATGTDPLTGAGLQPDRPGVASGGATPTPGGAGPATHDEAVMQHLVERDMIGASHTVREKINELWHALGQLPSHVKDEFQHLADALEKHRT